MITVGLAGSAMATHWDTFEAYGNCDGWTADGSIYFASYLQSIDVDWEVTLVQDGETVMSWSGVTNVLKSDPYLSLGEELGEDLCGEFTLSGYFHLPSYDDDTATF